MLRKKSLSLIQVPYWMSSMSSEIILKMKNVKKKLDFDWSKNCIIHHVVGDVCNVIFEFCFVVDYLTKMKQLVDWQLKLDLLKIFYVYTNCFFRYLVKLTLSLDANLRIFFCPSNYRDSKATRSQRSPNFYVYLWYGHIVYCVN